MQRRVILILSTLVVLVVGFALLWFFVLKPVPKLIFDKTVTKSEQTLIENAMQESQFKLTANLDVLASYQTKLPDSDNNIILSIKVPTSDFYDTRTSVARLDIDADKSITMIDVNDLTAEKKLLALDDVYYLDDLNGGAIFRVVFFIGNDGAKFTNAIADNFKIPLKNDSLSLIQTGTTALTRGMIIKLNAVGDPNHFSAKIGEFLSDADYTHTSNETSFVEGCSSTSGMKFCSPPAMLETLKSSGINIIELTGNHNNDFGRSANAETINTYRELGWGTFGGGLNDIDAAKPFEINSKKSKISMLGYNVPCDAIAGPDSAGANCYDYDDMVSSITVAKAENRFVIVDFQYYECYAYPDGYVEYPQCDAPIDGQTELFRGAIDAGADMVVGVSAHQPQTFELYGGKPIYYGLGNLYFDQVDWPGTKRGLVLKHYFLNGKYAQTKITPIEYDNNLQPKLMSKEGAKWMIERLLDSRP